MAGIAHGGAARQPRAMSSPLVITADAVLLDEVQRLAAAAGVTPEVCTSDHHALTRWPDAPLVLVGADVAAAFAALRPARRDATHVARARLGGDDIFSVALALGAESVAELPRSESWLVEVLTDAGDQAPRRGFTVGVVGGSGGAGATTFACALGQIGAGQIGAGRPEQVGAAPSSSTSTRWVRASTGFWASSSTTASGGTRCSRPPAGSAPGHCTTRSLVETGSASSRGRRGRPARCRRSPSGRPCRRRSEGTTSWCSTYPAARDVLVDADGRALRRAGRCRPAPPWWGGLGGADVRTVTAAGPKRIVSSSAGTGVPVAETSSGSTGLPGAIVMPDQRGLAESVDLGLGPVRSRRGPLHRAATKVLDHPGHGRGHRAHPLRDLGAQAHGPPPGAGGQAGRVHRRAHERPPHARRRHQPVAGGLRGVRRPVRAAWPRADESIAVMRGLLTGDWFEHHGEIYDVPRIKQCPVPATPIPIIVGGHAEPALRRAARNDGWIHGGGDLESLPGLITRLHELRAEEGRAATRSRSTSSRWTRTPSTGSSASRSSGSPT